MFILLRFENLLFGGLSLLTLPGTQSSPAWPLFSCCFESALSPLQPAHKGWLSISWALGMLTRFLKIRPMKFSKAVASNLRQHHLRDAGPHHRMLPQASHSTSLWAEFSDLPICFPCRVPARDWVGWAKTASVLHWRKNKLSGGEVLAKCSSWLLPLGLGPALHVVVCGFHRLPLQGVGQWMANVQRAISLVFWFN